MRDLKLCFVFICVCFLVPNAVCSVLCEEGFCRTYLLDVGCISAESSCRNNASAGISLLSPTLCNCCPYCLPFIEADQPCSVGGPGLGTTVGRCGEGLTCTQEETGNFCRRMKTKCHDAQDAFDEKQQNGLVGDMEQRPACDAKGKYAPYDCVPAHTCFCQSEEGERLFGEALNLGAPTAQLMHCGCSRFHDKITKSITAGVRFPSVGPRCTSEGNFNPIQCIDRKCFCVNRITGEALDRGEVDLDEKPITELPCYDAALDLFPEQSRGQPIFNYTTPCLEEMREKIEEILMGEEAGYIMDFFNPVPVCLPDGTYGRVASTRNGTKICVDESGRQIEGYEAFPNTPGYHNMECKCAQTAHLMASSHEKPVCCHNGSYRAVQCRRGMCRCVDSAGRTTSAAGPVETLPCYTEGWKTC